MIRIKILVQAHLQSPAILGGTHMAAMGKPATAVRKQARPISERTCYDERGQGQFALLADGRRKGIISSSHPLMPSSAVSLFFMLSFELTPCDFLIVGALNRLPSDRLA